MSVLARTAAHRAGSAWFHQVATIAVEHFDTRESALAAESAAIITEAPKYNVYRPKRVADVHFTLAVPPTIRNELVVAAAETGVPPREIIRRIVTSWCVHKGLITESEAMQ